MNIKDRIEQINDITIEIIKLKVKRLQVEQYLANGGDPKDLNSHSGTDPVLVDGKPF